MGLCACRPSITDQEFSARLSPILIPSVASSWGATLFTAAEVRWRLGLSLDPAEQAFEVLEYE